MVTPVPPARATSCSEKPMAARQRQSASAMIPATIRLIS